MASGTISGVATAIGELAPPRWGVVDISTFLDATILHLDDSAGEYGLAQVTVVDLHDGSVQYTATILGEARIAMPPQPTGEPSVSGGVLEGFPPELVPRGAVLLGASALPDGSLAAAHLRVDSEVASLPAFYERAILERWPQADVSVNETDLGTTVISFSYSGGSGDITIGMMGFPGDVFILLEPDT